MPPVAVAVKVMGVFAACGAVGEAATETAVNGAPLMVYQAVVFTSVPVTPSSAVTESRYMPAVLGVQAQVACAE